MNQCLASALGAGREVDVRTESNEMPRQGEVLILEDTAMTASATAAMSYRVAVFIDVVYRAARVEPRHYSITISILSGVADLCRENHSRRLEAVAF